jgi:hypothetical protein
VVELQSVNPPCKPLNLPPFAMWPAFAASDYYEGSINLHSIGDTTTRASLAGRAIAYIGGGPAAIWVSWTELQVQ